jgi:hypothetical protein
MRSLAHGDHAELEPRVERHRDAVEHGKGVPLVVGVLEPGDHRLLGADALGQQLARACARIATFIP